MRLYIDSIKKLKILKSKKPNVRWASSDDILHWYPYFPFIAHIDKNQCMTYNGEYYTSKERRKIIAETNSFFNSNKQLEIE